MENSQLYQIAFIIVALCILFYLCYLVYKKHTAIIEPDMISDAINRAINRVKDGLERAFNKVMDALMKPINYILSFVNMIVDFFKSIPKRFKNIGMGFQHFGTSFKQAFDNLGSELKGGFDGIGNGFIQSYRLLGAELDKEIIHNMGRGFTEMNDVLFDDPNKGITKLFSSIGKFLKDLKYIYEYIKTFFGTYIYNYLKCGIDKILNLPKCAFFYFLDILYGVFFYLPVMTAIFLLDYFFCVDANPYMDYMRDGLECMDENVRPFLGGYSLIHYSQSILDACYECRNLTPLPESPLHYYEEDAQVIHDDLEQMPKDVNEAVFRISYGLNRIPSGFNDAFDLLGHQLKASFEQIGRAFPDSMRVLEGQFKDAGHDIRKQFEWNYNDLIWKDKDFSATIDVPYYYQSIKKEGSKLKVQK